MSELTPSLIPLDKGLNLQTAKLVAPVGSVLDTLNYEQVDFQGQKRIDGFVRYDGTQLVAFDEYYQITVSTDWTASGNAVISVEDGILGRLVGTHPTNPRVFYISVINENLIPEVGDSVYVLSAGVNTDGHVITAIGTGTELAADPEEHYTILLDALATRRFQIMELPGSVAGLHWFRDRLYAVADVVVISLEGTTPVIYPNDVLDSFPTAKVLDSFVRDNTRLVFLDSMYQDDWGGPGTEVFRDGESVGFIANGYENLTIDDEIASFYVALNEQNATDADTTYGWHFIDLGWSVNFENGLSLFGSLPSLNQNITGLGIQGPTSTANDNGAPLVLTQKINTTNTVAQVNGWKSSQTPTTYELETDNLLDIDDDTIYADAYISWNGTTGEVVGYVEPLVEYPATNTVEVDIT